MTYILVIDSNRDKCIQVYIIPRDNTRAPARLKFPLATVIGNVKEM
jgi:hypothetical protein